jgi:spore germination cell wall hydrolase CwlJ-like protein
MRATVRRGKRSAKARGSASGLIFPAVVVGVGALWLAGRGGWLDLAEPNDERLSREQAKALNASIPFVDAKLVAARPYRFRGTPAGREQAVQCLATAALYEAGADGRGQKAVIQVVLNRLALPQYPNTVCGVVYQGSDRPSGCQFSFTCDGSVVRRPEYAGWPKARAAAKRALNGYVFTPVGRATHYHTDWTVPYWASSLDKIAQIESHIFYRPRSRRGGGDETIAANVTKATG